MATTESFAQTLAAKQPRLLAAFKHIIAQNHLAHAYLFAGMEGAGQPELAHWIAQRLFCLHINDGEPDGTCEECVRIANGSHPDIAKIYGSIIKHHVDRLLLHLKKLNFLRVQTKQTERSSR